MTLAATIPSGYPTIVATRESIIANLCSVPWPLNSGAPTTFRLVLGADDTIMPGEVYVGAGFSTFAPSPWAPLPEYGIIGCADYCDYLWKRADILYHVSHLVGKRIVADPVDIDQVEALLHAVSTLFPPKENSEQSFDIVEDDDFEVYGCPDRANHKAEFSSYTHLDHAAQLGHGCTLGAMAWANESLLGAPASGLKFTDEWRSFMQHLRSFNTKFCWELFAGTCIVTSIWLEMLLPTAPPVDVLFSQWMDLLNPGFLYIVLGIILEKRVCLLWLGPPCASFSMAINRFSHLCMRSLRFPDGIPELQGLPAVTVAMGNALRDVAISCAKTQHSVGETYDLEQPDNSLMLPCEAFTHMEEATGATRAYRHQCLDGAPWAKLTVVVSNEPAISEVQGFCQGGHDHIVLEGRDPQGVAWTKRASSYWPPFARKVIKPLTRGLDIRRDTTSNWRAGFTGIDLGYTAVDLLRMAQYRPSRGKDIQAVAFAISSAVQPGRRAVPQLVPDHLDPDTHVAVATSLQHPFQWTASAPVAVEHALKHCTGNCCQLGQQRATTWQLSQTLAGQCTGDNKIILAHVEVGVRQVLQSGGLTKNVAFMRELGYAVQHRDILAMPALVVGSRMLGASHPIATMPQRVVHATMSVDELVQQRHHINSKVAQLASRSDDKELAQASWDKSEQELKRGVIRGPFEELERTEFSDPVLCWRKAVWEDRTVEGQFEARNIDDMLVSMQNETAAYTSTHVPMTADSVSIQTSAVARKFPGQQLAGHPSDYAKAYEQIPGHPTERDKFVLSQAIAE